MVDPYAGVGLAGAFIPGLSAYRSSPVALGTMALYAFLLTAVTARYTRLLPAGAWLSIHRLALVVWVLAWLHGLLAGTDVDTLRPLYVASGLAIVAAGAYRYWASRQGRPTFTATRPEGHPMSTMSTSSRRFADGHRRRGLAAPRFRSDPGLGRVDGGRGAAACRARLRGDPARSPCRRVDAIGRPP